MAEDVRIPGDMGTATSGPPPATPGARSLSSPGVLVPRQRRGRPAGPQDLRGGNWCKRESEVDTERG